MLWSKLGPFNLLDAKTEDINIEVFFGNSAKARIPLTDHLNLLTKEALKGRCTPNCLKHISAVVAQGKKVGVLIDRVDHFTTHQDFFY